MPDEKGALRRGAPPSPFVELPAHPFLYTLDQVAFLLSVSDKELKRKLQLRGRSPGPKNLNLIEAFNIAEPTEKPEWRISETELRRWLARKGYRIV
jgi:hypothetical protein